MAIKFTQYKSIFKCESHNVKYICNSLYIIKLMVIQIYIKEFKFITFRPRFDIWNWIHSNNYNLNID
jgi:hypothetical protein